MGFSGSADVTAAVTAVDLPLPRDRVSTSGCEAGDFAGFTAGHIALIQRGSCTFRSRSRTPRTRARPGDCLQPGRTPGRRPDLFGGGSARPVGTIPVASTPSPSVRSSTTSSTLGW